MVVMTTAGQDRDAALADWLLRNSEKFANTYDGDLVKGRGEMSRMYNLEELPLTLTFQVLS